MIRRAEGLLRRMPTLRSSGQAEDLVQGFLVDQVISRPDAMLGPAARGVRPLWPRLNLSFRHYCIQTLRRLARHPMLVSEDVIEAEAATDVGDRGIETPREGSYRAESSWIRQDTIRRAFSEQELGLVPLRHLLLLSERLFLAQLIETSFAEADRRPDPEITIPELVNRIAPWSLESRGRSCLIETYLWVKSGIPSRADTPDRRRCHHEGSRRARKHLGSADPPGTSGS